MTRGDYLGEFELVVMLALARLDEAAYGMSIYDEILATTGRDVSIQAVYVTLNRLEKKGHVTSAGTRDVRRLRLCRRSRKARQEVLHIVDLGPGRIAPITSDV
jgi:DNA-binding PadR family transcriptional regulator